MPLNDYEIISIFYKKFPIYNPQMTVGKPYNNFHKPNDSGECYGKTSYSSVQNCITRYPKRIINFNVDKKAKYHPTQKPVELMEYLIKTYSNEGDTILDFTCGSGSTLVGCVNTNRNGIGIELEKNYYDIAKGRIAKAYENQKSIFDIGV